MSTPAILTVSPRKFQFVGGDLCLDFTNTVGATRGPTAREYLNSYTDFVSWCRQGGLVTESKANALLRLAAGRPGDAGSAFQRAIVLREAIYRIFAALAQDRSPQSSDLDQLNAELSVSLGRLRVTPGRKVFDWTWADADDAFDEPLGPIARSAAELLTAPPLLACLRQCEGDTCGWLFVDSTKNHSRRWCVMSDCGNVAKVRRFRLKKRRKRSDK
jgi:predicted RNA-binding Zn ribbon-like protein